MISLRGLWSSFAVCRSSRSEYLKRMILPQSQLHSVEQKPLFSRDYSHTVLAFGDSNTWGFDPASPGNGAATLRHPYRSRWTTQVGQLLGNSVHLIPEGLNSRTTIFPDPLSPCEGEYNCNGRIELMTALHTHKPLSCVVLALGTNDLKGRFSVTPAEIVGGIRVLVRDVQRATGISGGKDGCQSLLSLQAPKVLVISPPIIYSTEKSKLWGFGKEVEEKSKLIPTLLVAMKTEDVDVLDLTAIAKVSPLDGIHFDAEAHTRIASAVADKIKALLSIQ